MFNVEWLKHHNRLHGPRLVAVSCLAVCVSLAIPELLSYATLQLAHITVSDSTAAAAPALPLPVDMNSIHCATASSIKRHLSTAGMHATGSVHAEELSNMPDLIAPSWHHVD
jgi:hypothetical protein